MIRFSFLEERGLRVAAMSGIAEGDCSGKAPSLVARRRFMSRCDAPYDDLACPKQVHGVSVIAVDEGARGRGAAGPDPGIAEADALITMTPGVPLGITVADCVPVYLYEARRQAVGLAHAGREGTRGGIVLSTVGALEEQYRVRPEDLVAVIGPSAGPDRYEVSGEIAEDWRMAGLPATGRHLDLWEANRQQLLQAGLKPENIEITAYCTIAGDLFYSYRATGTAARNLCLAML